MDDGYETIHKLMIAYINSLGPLAAKKAAETIDTILLDKPAIKLPPELKSKEKNKNKSFFERIKGFIGF